MPKLRYGHAPGHVRDAALAAFEAWAEWNGDGTEPTVEYEIHYKPHQVTVSQMCKVVWNCTDYVPICIVDRLIDEGLETRSGTYAGCARAILRMMNLRTAA